MEDIKNIETNIENMKDKIRNNGNHQWLKQFLLYYLL
jgi:hypothetical protein